MPQNESNPTPLDGNVELYKEERQRKLLLILLLLLVISLCCVGFLFICYLQKPKPLPELLPPVVNVNYPPHYLFSIYGLDNPVGVSISADGERIYVTETGGDRLIKAFDRNGKPLYSFSPPNTTPGERSPVYTAVDPSGRIFVSDRLQHAIFVYDKDGKYLDTILSPQMSLNSYIASQIGGMPAGIIFYYSVFKDKAHYQLPGKTDSLLPAPKVPEWNPLGIRFDKIGNMWLTDVIGEKHTVKKFPAGDLVTWPAVAFKPQLKTFGKTGQNPGEFLFPNVSILDSQNRVYVTDGNNGRVSVWDQTGQFLFEFGRSTGDSAISLPRGEAIDDHDHLHIVDAVGQNVKVYDVSGPEPVFLFAFGDWGIGDGLFNYPNDIALDHTGRLYIADRENNRVQVWSY